MKNAGYRSCSLSQYKAPTIPTVLMSCSLVEFVKGTFVYILGRLSSLNALILLGIWANILDIFCGDCGLQRYGVASSISWTKLVLDEMLARMKAVRNNWISKEWSSSVRELSNIF